jgi:hypothetical protein
MRKLFFLFAILGIAGLVACGSGADTAEDQAQADAEAAQVALQESISSIVADINAVIADLDAKIETADEASKVELTNLRMKLDQFGSNVSNATAEEIENVKAQWEEMKAEITVEGAEENTQE